MLRKMGGVGISATSVMLLLCAVSSVNSFSKFGRGCKDIGCMPNEECVLSSESCSYNQREGQDCGSYPTCTKKSGGGGSSSSPVNPSGSSLKPGSENTIFSSSSSSSSSASNPSLNTHTYNHNGNSIHNPGSGSSATATQNGVGYNGYPNQNHNNNHNNNNNNHGNNNDGGGGGGGTSNGGNGNGRPNQAIIDPHYVFGAPQSFAVLPNLPIFPFNAPTPPPSFQQFPQPNHPGAGLSPSFPHGLQPVNPYNPSFVFGSQPFYSPSGTGGPPAGFGSFGSSSGGLAPHGINYGGMGGYQNPNMYNKPPPQYQNQNQHQQNPYNRQTQSHPGSSAVRLGGGGSANVVGNLALTVLGCVIGVLYIGSSGSGNWST